MSRCAQDWVEKLLVPGCCCRTAPKAPHSNTNVQVYTSKEVAVGQGA
jgi:hypothetical protein